MLWQPFATVAVGTPQHVEAAIDAASAAFPAWAALSWGERSSIVLQLASSLQARLEVTSDCFFSIYIISELLHLC
jgi:aminomuconate-semialdehyde/2-hydroxymuconate-6-semialdehyde dehydrogenase